jgi:hypothetical protein
MRNKVWLGLAIGSWCASALASEFCDDFAVEPGWDDVRWDLGAAGWTQGGGVGGGGYLSLTDTETEGCGVSIFRDLDAGALVQGFSLSVDLRIGGGSSQPGGGMSVNFVPISAPWLLDLWAHPPPSELPLSCTNRWEEGSPAGLSISLHAEADSAGNEAGITIRFNNSVLASVALPTPNGECSDPTSLQTGPLCSNPSNSLERLCWGRLQANVATDGLLNVAYKGRMIATNLLVSWLPSPGELVFTARTGDAPEHHHVDNVCITKVLIIADPPKITRIRLEKGEISLTWTNGGELYGTDTLSRPGWTRLSSGASYSEPAGTKQRFYQVLRGH